MKVRLSELRRVARFKPPGYLEECLAAGRVVGSCLALTQEEFDRLHAKYRGWGDKLHDFLAPFVRWIDRLFRTKLRNCGGCKRRQEMLNSLGYSLTFKSKVNLHE